MKVTYKWIQGPELERLEPTLIKMGWASLNPVTCRAIIAEDEDDRIVAFLVIQLFPHVEPLYVAPGYRGTNVTEDLVTAALEFMAEIRIRGFLAITDNPFAEQLCIKNGMNKVESPVYMKVG